MRWRSLFFVFAAVLAACGSEATPATSTSPAAATSTPIASTTPTTTVPTSTTVSPTSTTTTITTTTTVSRTVSTTVTTTVVPQPDPTLVFFRFDSSGLYRVDAAGEHRIEAEAVVSASHDGWGGVIYAREREAGQAGLQWWKAGGAASETLPYPTGWVTILEERPTLVRYSGTCPARDDGTLAHLVDLRTGAARVAGCFGGEDAGNYLTSGGGPMLVGVFTYGPGASFTDRTIDFYDVTGAEFGHPLNPVAESCEPCELDALLSPDGELLAYRLRPDAKWSPDPDERQRRDAMTYEEWWETTKHIDGEVMVVDLATGDTKFTMTVPAGEVLADFDGRFLVLESCHATPVEGHGPSARCESRVVDTAGEVDEPAVTGSVRLASVVWGDPPLAQVFGPHL